jgi:hypothetical protein
VLLKGVLVWQVGHCGLEHPCGGVPGGVVADARSLYWPNWVSANMGGSVVLLYQAGGMRCARSQ